MFRIGVEETPSLPAPARDDEEKAVNGEQSNTQQNLEDESAFLVNWDHNDPENPHNWSTPYRAWLTLQLGMLALASSTASAIIAPANPTVAKLFHVSQDVVVLNVSLFV
jgi:hypothetical protein